jgi:RNA polymerase sigma-70 factor (ECF subfamily)
LAPVEGRPPDETEVVRRAKDGDVDAYAALVRTHQAAARRLARALGGTGDDADDVAQEAFVKAWHALDRFREDAPFRPFLLRIVANEAHNRRRAAGRRARYELRAAEDRASGGAAPSPEDAVLAAERHRALARALATLPDRHRDVVACRHLLGLGEAETAAVLGLRPGTVKSRLRRGLDRLHAELVGGAAGARDDG